MPAGVDASTPLTPHQRRFMLVLQARISARPDIGPSYDELRIDLGLASKSGVFRLVRECELRGRLSRVPGCDRTLRVLRPVTDGDGDPVGLLKAFSDSELLREVSARGLLTLRLP